jgi:hypothetical protein
MKPAQEKNTTKNNTNTHKRNTKGIKEEQQI